MESPGTEPVWGLACLCIACLMSKFLLGFEYLGGETLDLASWQNSKI